MQANVVNGATQVTGTSPPVQPWRGWNWSKGDFYRLIVLILVAGGMRYAFYMPDTSPDTTRFFQQAAWMLDGKGYLDPRNGEYCTSLPPGYPALLMAISVFSGTEMDNWQSAAHGVNIVLSIGACVLLFLSMRAVSPWGAFWCGLLIAVSPLPLRHSGYLLSETLSTCLVAAMVCCLSLLERRVRNGIAALGMGFTSVCALLVAPAVIFLSFFLWCRAAWIVLRDRNWGAASLLTVGALLPLIPWQIHCIKATGKPIATVFKNEVSRDNGYVVWLRSWIRDEQDYQIRWYPERIVQAPKSVFLDEQERQYLHDVLIQHTKRGRKADDAAADIEYAFRPVAERRRLADPAAFYIWLPLYRSVTLWFDFSGMIRERGERLGQRIVSLLFRGNGTSSLQSVIRSGTAVAAVIAFNSVHFILFLTLIGSSIRSRGRAGAVVPCLILAGVLAYTGLSAYSAANEMRRNLPFYPVMLFAAFYAAMQRSGSETTATLKSAARHGAELRL